MAETLHYDSSKLTTLSGELSEEFAIIKETSNTINKNVTELSSCWSGPDYDAFIKSYNEFRDEAMEPIIKALDGWQGFVDERQTASTTTTEENLETIGGGA